MLEQQTGNLRFEREKYPRGRSKVYDTELGRVDARKRGARTHVSSVPGYLAYERMGGGSMTNCERWLGACRGTTSG